MTAGGVRHPGAMVEATDAIELTAAEARVLGALVEKQLTTPDAYPLTLKALTAACNQTSSRDPVMSHEPNLVETTLLVLKAKGMARVVHPGSGERATKYRQVADEALHLDPAERAVACVLLARRPNGGGAQGPYRAAAPVRLSRRDRDRPRCADGR